MTRFTSNLLRCFLSLVLSLCALTCLAQSGRSKTPPPQGSSADTRGAQALYEEANNYITRKYEEFNRQNVSFDPRIEAAIRQEQKDLAARHAATVAARGTLTGNDLYYLGLLYHLADNSEGALGSLRQFLAGSPAADLAQTARAAVVVHALKKQLWPEAESTLEQYSRQQPQSDRERYGMETLVADAFYRQKDYQKMAAHASEMFKAARAVAATGIEPLKRDQMLFKSALLLSEAYRKLGKKELAVSTAEELRRVALSLPSGNLYKMATNRLAEIEPGVDTMKLFEQTGTSPATGPPEIVAAQWLDQTPGKLADFRGRVVLLDFWAPWCGPCRITFPKLKSWHDKYRENGLVILGLTNYYGEIDGHSVNRQQELAYLRDFKKKNRLPYGFAIANSRENDTNYGVGSIPMSFLIDRRGAVRFIAAGSSEEQTAALGRMIKKLLDEPVENTDITAKGRHGEEAITEPTPRE